jgi:hypothetical protein
MDLEAFFREAGKVLKKEIEWDKHGRSTGNANIIFSSSVEA